MALSPDDDINQSFQREVDEKMREDQMADFAKKYGTWIVLGVILFLAAVGGWLYWQNQQRVAAGKSSEELALAVRDIGEGDLDGVPERLEALSGEAEGATRASALMARAAVALKQGDRTKAVETYGTVAGDESLPDPYRNLALIRQTLLEFDRIEPDAVITRLQPLAQPGEPFYGSAGEITAIAMIRAGRDKEAAQLFADIAANDQVPDTLRSRAGQIAGTLGVDASASLTSEEDQ